MKNVFTFLLLSALAVTLALLVGDNTASVSVFWAPYRIDLSLNLALLLLLLTFVLLYLMVRTWRVLRGLPEQARRWRMQHLERTLYSTLLQAWAYLLSGRFVRAQEAAQRALSQLAALPKNATPAQAEATVLAHWLVAESAHALGNPDLSEQALQQALTHPAGSVAVSAREGLLLRATAWAIEKRDTEAGNRWLAQLPQGAARRIQALRLRLRLAQLQRDTHAALDMVRLLAKHHAFTPRVAVSVLRGLIQDALRETHDADQLMALWQTFNASERAVPDLALAMLQRWQRLRRASPDSVEDIPPSYRRVLEQSWQTVWDAYAQLSDDARRRLALCFESALPQLDPAWLAQIERLQQAHPADPHLQYLAGQAYMQHRLWGKAAFMLGQASHGLSDAELARRTWCSLALLAEERDDTAAAQVAWKKPR